METALGCSVLPFSKPPLGNFGREGDERRRVNGPHVVYGSLTRCESCLIILPPTKECGTDGTIYSIGELSPKY